MSLDDVFQAEAAPAEARGGPAANGKPPRRFYRQTDIGNAERFRDLHRGVVLYVPEWRRWIVWDGTRWTRDLGDIQVMALAKQTAIAIYDDLDVAKLELQQAAEYDDAARIGVLTDVVNGLVRHAPRSSTEPRLRAMLTLAQSEAGMSVPAADLDRDMRVLNTPSGVVSLETGAQTPHDPVALCTHITSAAYDPAAPCAFWESFLESVFKSDSYLIRYVQRLVGLALVGNPGVRLLPMCHGAGANGKTAFFECLRRRLGDYAATGDAGGLLLSKDDGRPNEHVADLAGRRLVVLPELPSGKLNTSRMKRLTGGDRIATHRKFEHRVEFTPTHTFFVYTNDRPEVPEGGPAVWDRLRLIPFAHTFEGEDRLSPEVVQANLDAEASGILAWCIKGAVDYLRDGLGPEPECVRAATREYEEEEDTLGRFLEECTKPVAEAWTSSKDLYAAYKAWCSDSGVTPEAQVQFGRELVRHGVMSHARNGRKGYLGVQLEGTLV